MKSSTALMNERMALLLVDHSTHASQLMEHINKKRRKKKNEIQE